MAVTASQAPKNVPALIEQVNDDRTLIEITSRRGDAVLLSRADYNAPEETAHLLRMPANARRVVEDLQRALAGQRECPTSSGELVLTPHGWEDGIYWLAADRACQFGLRRLRPFAQITRERLSSLRDQNPQPRRNHSMHVCRC